MNIIKKKTKVYKIFLFLKKDSSEIKEDKIECREVLSVSEVFCYKIWLHAFNYKFEEYEFKTTPPDWATKEYELNIKF